MNVLPTIYFMLIFGMLSLGLNMRLEERARSLEPDRAQNTIVQLALAQHRFISDPANPAAGSYAMDIAALAAAGYLPVWEPDPDFSFVNTTPPGLVIQYQAESNAQAARTAARLGAIAQVNGNLLTVGFADPTDLALLDGFVQRAGDEMTGPLRFAAGIGDALDLNQNSLTDVFRLRARNATATGAVEADIIVGSSGTFNDININP